MTPGSESAMETGGGGAALGPANADPALEVTSTVVTNIARSDGGVRVLTQRPAREHVGTTKCSRAITARYMAAPRAATRTTLIAASAGPTSRSHRPISRRGSGKREANRHSPELAATPSARRASGHLTTSPPA